MTVSYFVHYRGDAADRTAFLDHYRNSHAPILLGFPGLRNLTLHHGIACDDPFPVQSEGSLMMAQMTFDAVDDLNRALASQERQLARQDFTRFPPFQGSITHQAMRAEEVAR